MKVSVIIHEVEVDEARNILDMVAPQVLTTENTAPIGMVSNRDTGYISEQVVDPVTATIEAAAEAGLIPQPTVDGTEGVPNVVTEIDKDGLPWDARIHSSNGKKTAKGYWQRRRGLDELTFITVKNELLGLNVAPTVAPVEATNIFEQAVPTLAPAPVRTYETFMQKMADLFAAGTIDQEYVSLIVQEINHGFKDTNIAVITEIAPEPAFVEFAWDVLERDGHA